jgi:hypothetical protein
MIITMFISYVGFSQVFRRPSYTVDKEHNFTAIISRISKNKEALMGRRVLVRWVLHWDGKWQRR